jgi:ABC-type multidrug transport system fused ATPase/permease subunit
VVIILLTSIFPALQLWLQKQSINNISNISKSNEYWKISILLICVLYMSNIISALLIQFEDYLFVVISETVNFKVRRKLLEKAICLPLENYEQDEFYNKLMMANESVTKNSIIIVNYAFMIIQQLFTLVGVLGMLALVHWSLPVALFLSSFPGIVLLIMVKNKRFKMMVRTAPISREMEYTSNILIQKNYAREIRIFKLGSYLIQRWEGLFEKVKKIRFKQSGKEASSKFIGATILQISSFLVAIFLIYQIKNRYLTIGDYVALLGAITSVQSIFGAISMYIGNIAEVSMYNNALFDFLEREDNLNSLEDTFEFPTDQFDKLAIRNLCFSYPNSDRKVLDDISVVIKKGEKVAIVGENGAGKTTLVNCILGLYKPTSGEIHFGNLEISKINTESLRENISAVFQEFAQYKYTVRENIGFGKLSSIKDNDKIIDIIEKVGLIKVINKFPLGIEASLGKQFRNGEELSGGEWQRIAIGRALIRNAEIVVLDEPTASLDPIAELDIFKCFKQVATNKTSIMISHRLGPVRFAERIIVLKDGKIVEEGHHEFLLGLKGEYSKMYLAQAEWYKDEK